MQCNSKEIETDITQDDIYDYTNEEPLDIEDENFHGSYDDEDNDIEYCD